MEFNCDWGALRQASELAAHVVPVQNSYLSIDARDHRLRVEGGAPALQVAIEVDATVSEEGRRAVMLKPWLELMRLGEAEQFKARTSGRAMDIVVALRGDRTTLRTVDSDVLGLAEAVTTGERIVLRQSAFVRAIRDVIFVVAERDDSPAIRLRTSGSVLELTALARNRASWSNAPIATPAPAFTLLVPPRALEQVARAPTKDGQIIEVIYEPGHAMRMAAGAVIIRSGVLGVEFPEFDRPAPMAGDTRATIGQADLLRALQFAEVFAEDRSVLVEVRPPNLVGLQTKSSVVGTHRAYIDARTVGEACHARLDCTHLLELARSLDDETLVFDFSTKHVLVKADGREGFLHVLSYMLESV